MPKIPIDECPAGPEMDAAVAEALGWGYINSSRFGGWCWRYPDNAIGRLYKSSPAYSTDIAAAWELWELLSKQEPWSWALYSEGEEVAIEYYGEDYLGEREAGCGDWEREGKAPLAICRAFLKANGVEHVEVPG